MVRPQIERQELRRFAYFASLSYHASSSFSDDRRTITFFWIKVRYDDGLMHIKVKYSSSRYGLFSLTEVLLVEYRTGKHLEDTLPLF